MAKAATEYQAANDQDVKPKTSNLSPKSQEIVVGLVSYAGAFDANLTEDLANKLSNDFGYNVFDPIKLSNLIEREFPSEKDLINVGTGARAGKSRLLRAKALQNLGDKLRIERGDEILALLAIKEILDLRGGPPTEKKNAFIIDSLKHQAEVDLLRQVYGEGFRLVGVHCSRVHRLSRLSNTKFRNADETGIEDLLDRDEKDEQNDHGQQVRKVFHVADYFIDNNQKDQGARYTSDLLRFLGLSLGKILRRPTPDETGMYFDYTSALRSAFLSRQVGAALQSATGEIISTDTNEVPKYGGGVYSDNEKSASGEDNRCFNWKDWNNEDGKNFKVPYCHNSRKKNELRIKIAKWLGDNFSEKLAEAAVPQVEKEESDTLLKEQKKELDKKRAENVTYAATQIESFFAGNVQDFDKIPGIKEIVEYSRSIHAEMDAILNAARMGVSPGDSTLFTTTYPCHNCARHIVAAGVKKVYYMEPFVKSLAEELHSDCLVHETEKSGYVSIMPYTGAGPRMYEEHFLKAEDLKIDATGEYKELNRGTLRRSINLLSLEDIEARAAEMADSSTR